jgi:TRAP-type mannitol/chloroaromatic compound transport system substrate-binding protein
MSLRAALVAILVAFGVGLVGSLALRPAAPRVRGEVETTALPALRWRLATAFGTNLPVLGDNPVALSAGIAEASSGRMRLDIFEPGEIVPAFSIVDAVREGKIEAGYTWLGYDQGWLPASVLFGAVPFGMEPWEYAAWWYEAGGEDLAREIYLALGVRPLLCGLIGPETAGWFREELRGPEDLAGLKIRFAGLGGKAMQALGASVTMLPGGEIFQALERGAIDATEFSLPIVDQRLGFDRVAPINYFPGWHQPFTAFHLVVNVDDWEELGPAGEALLELACQAGVIRKLSRGEALQGAVLRTSAEKGVRVLRPPAEILAALEIESQAILEEEAARDVDFARVLESQRAFSADYALWKDLAYLRAGEGAGSDPDAPRP